MSAAKPDARVYAGRLLAALGRSDTLPLGGEAHPAQRWAESGLMALTGGYADSPQMCPAPLASCADGVGLALQALAPGSGMARIACAERLSERAALAGYTRNGRITPGGSCRLLDAQDGHFAINLARPDDWALLPAWLEVETVRTWADVSAGVARRRVRDLEQRARLLGLPATPMTCPPSMTPPWFRVTERGPAKPPKHAPLVVDLSALWAGPLCSHLLAQLGARVIKVESRTRPDGARNGPAAFYDLINAGKASVVLDFDAAEGLSALRALLARADIVIESARPRGLRQLGIDAETLVRQRSGLTWLSITGYGRVPPGAEWVGFGDDAGIAAGLSGLMAAVTGQPLVVADAIADPLTGLHAALAAQASHQAGGGRLVSLALRDVAAHCLRFGLPATTAAWRQRQSAWRRCAADVSSELPRPRSPAGQAAQAGVDNDRILTRLDGAGEFGII